LERVVCLLTFINLIFKNKVRIFIVAIVINFSYIFFLPFQESTNNVYLLGFPFRTFEYFAMPNEEVTYLSRFTNFEQLNIRSEFILNSFILFLILYLLTKKRIRDSASQ